MHEAEVGILLLYGGFELLVVFHVYLCCDTSKEVWRVDTGCERIPRCIGPMTRVKLIPFDALYTLIKPRLPVYAQYSEAFTPFLGALDPAIVKRAFKTGLSSRLLVFGIPTHF